MKDSLKKYHTFKSSNISIEKSTIIILSIFIFLFLSLPRKFKRQTVEPTVVKISLEVEDIPVTVQKVRKGVFPPNRPVIPLPVEEVNIPNDQIVDMTLILWNAGDSPFGSSIITRANQDTIPPRPIKQVFPEYPEQARKDKISGTIRLLLKVSEKGQVVDVIVSKNTTGDKLCEQAAIDAAFQNLYSPGKIANEPMEMWTICDYGFKPE